VKLSLTSILFCTLMARLILPDLGYADVVQSSEVKGVRDFVEYWSASRLLLTGDNPYSPAELLSIQKTAGWSNAEPLIMWNPPWTFPFILWFGLMDFTSGQFLWLLAQTSFIIISAQLLWRINGQFVDGSWIPWLLALTFVSTGFVLIIGQITPLILLGVTLFIYFERQKNWLGIAIAITILSVKPHLSYLVWPVLALWIWQGKEWRIVFATVVSVACVAVIPLMFDRQIYSEYFALYRFGGITKPLDWPTPTLGNMLKIFFDFDGVSIQVIPSLIAVVWVLWYWQRHKQDWQWSVQLPLIVLVSVTTNFFVWTYDQVVFLPALIQGASWLVRNRLPWYRSIAALLYIGANLTHVVLRFLVADERWYFWLAPTLLTAYLFYLWESDHGLVTASSRV
jgi:hypothetical protein